MNKFKVCVLPGDGIGPEVMSQALKVIGKIEKIYNLKVETLEGYIGGIAIGKYQEPLPQKTIDLCKKSDAVLLGSIGGTQWDHLPHDKRPEVGGLLALRKALDLYANIRPVVLFDKLRSISPLSPRVTAKGIDLVAFRELSSGIYYGYPKELNEKEALDTMIYRLEEVERIARVAFHSAQKRRKLVTSVDKANALNASVLWRKTVTKLAKDYPDVQLKHMYVDNAAMQIILNPSQFDVILTSNLFGDIISDESAAITNSIGFLPSASLGKDVNLFESAGGSAPDIAGKNIANPIAQIFSVAMMFDYSFKRQDISNHIYQSVDQLINDGLKTRDISRGDETPVSTSEFGDLLCKQLQG